MTDADMNLIVGKVIIHFNEQEMRRQSRELREKNKFICTTNRAVSEQYCKLNAGHTIDLRYLCLVSCLLEIKNRGIEGDIAELGVFRGAFAKRIHALLPDRHFYLLDTFQGFNQDQFSHDLSKYRLVGCAADNERFSNTSVDTVLKNIGGNDNFIHPVIGFFPNTAEAIKDNIFSFVSLDADLYQVMKDGINFFYPRLARGGYIMVHDFNNASYPGTHDAILETITREHIPYIPIPDDCGSIIISKPI